MKGKLTDWLTN